MIELPNNKINMDWLDTNPLLVLPQLSFPSDLRPLAISQRYWEYVNYHRWDSHKIGLTESMVIATGVIENL